MSAFRSEFYSTVQSMLTVVSSPLLTDVFPPNDPHNISARILRTGLAVIAFALVERYLKSIFDSLVTDVARSSIRYSHFPDAMKKFLVADSISGLHNSAFFIKDQAQKLIYLEAEVNKLSSFSSVPPIFTAFGFSPSGSNVGHEDINQGFKAFGVADVWGKLTNIASIIGSGSLSLKNDYISLANSRHKSAHEASNIPTSDLLTNLNSAITIGMSADILGMKLGKTIKMCQTAGSLSTTISAMTFELRYLDHGLDGKWLERPNISGRVIKKYADREGGKTGMLARATSDPIVVRDTSSVPIELVV